MFADFDRLFNEFEKMLLTNNGRRKTFRSDDGSFYVTTLYSNYEPTTEDKLKSLKYELDRMIELQEFEKAVEIRDRIKKLESNKDEIEKLNSELSESIKNQDFEKCVVLRDKIKSLK